MSMTDDVRTNQRPTRTVQFVRRYVTRHRRCLRLGNMSQSLLVVSKRKPAHSPLERLQARCTVPYCTSVGRLITDAHKAIADGDKT